MAEIEFICPPDRAPLDAERCLREFGVKVWGRDVSDPDEDPDALRYVTINVRDGQLLWAARLIAGDGFTVLSPNVSSGVKLKTKWGKPQRSWSPQSIVIYLIEIFLARYNEYKGIPVKNSWSNKSAQKPKQRAVKPVKRKKKPESKIIKFLKS